MMHMLFLSRSLECGAAERERSRRRILALAAGRADGGGVERGDEIA